MKGWNVIITVYQGGYRRTLRALTAFGLVERSPYHNVLIMRVDDPAVLLPAIEQRTEESPVLYLAWYARCFCRINEPIVEEALEFRR